MIEKQRSAEDIASEFVGRLFSEMLYQCPPTDVVYTAGPCPQCGEFSRGSRLCVDCRVKKVGALGQGGTGRAETMLQSIREMQEERELLALSIKVGLELKRFTPAQLEEILRS